jgi:glycosyltransferase involved in cell wall biosynthesis
MSKIDISIVVNAHREGLLVIPTLRSAVRSRNFALAEGYVCELIVVLDSSDKITYDVVQKWASSDVRIIEVNHRDPGIARNEAVAAAKGEWIAFLDGDDLWGENWLSSAVRCANADRRLIVWHPEVSIYFGEASRIFRHIDMEEPDFSLYSMVASNPWTALHFSPRELLSRCPYVATGPIGYEDWDWNVAVVEMGAIHKVVPGSGHAIRVKNLSRLKSTNNAQASLSPTMFFRNIVGKKLGAKARSAILR